MNGLTIHRNFIVTALGILSLVATVASSAPLSPAGNTGSDVSLALVANQGSIRPGEEITFTATMTNQGPQDATFVDVAFALPDQLEMVSMTCDLGISADTPFCEYSSLPAGATVVTTVVARLRTDVTLHGRMLKTSARVVFETADSLDPDTHNNSAVIKTKINTK